MTILATRHSAQTNKQTNAVGVWQRNNQSFLPKGRSCKNPRKLAAAPLPGAGKAEH